MKKKAMKKRDPDVWPCKNEDPEKNEPEDGLAKMEKKFPCFEFRKAI